MSYPYKKLHLSTPKPYQELTRHRPTKKKNYNYSINAEAYPEIVNIPLTNSQRTPQYRFHSKEKISCQIKNLFIEKQQEQKVSSKKAQRELILQFNNYKVGQKLISERHDNQNQKTNDLRIINIKQIQIQDDQIHEQDFNLKLTNQNQSKRNQNETFTLKSPIDKINLSKSSQQSKSKQIINKAGFKKNNQIYTTEENLNNKQNRQSTTSLQISNSKICQDMKKKQKMQPLIQRAFKKVQYYYGQIEIDKNKIVQIVKQNYEKAIKKQNNFRKQCQLDIQIEQIKKKILNNSPFMMPLGIANFQQTESSFNPEICKISDNLRKIIELDINLLKLRQDFESQQTEGKWQTLKSELSAKNIQFQINELKEEISVSFYQKDPFSTKRKDYKFYKAKELATIYAEGQRIWVQQVEKCTSLEEIRQKGSLKSLQDLQTICNLNLQDLACFINVNSQTLYRSRDVFSLFRRFMKLQGKKVEKKVSLYTFKYQTFISKVSK